MVAIFVSYRRATDESITSTLIAELNSKLGSEHVFYDKSETSLRPGCLWPHELVSNLMRCEALVAVIGPSWLSELKKRNCPSDHWKDAVESEDWVRREIGTALQLGRKVAVLLVNGAVMPDEKDLPPDLALMSSIQSAKFTRGTESVDELIRNLNLTTTRTLTPIPSLTRSLRGEDEFPSDANGSHGKRWHPDHETDSVHYSDYKFAVLDPEIQRRAKTLLLAAKTTGVVNEGYTLAELKRFGLHRKWQNSDAKQGLFIQASCFVTDGMDTGDFSRVLLCIREKYQFHNHRRLEPDEINPRFVKGESCLIASCLSSFHKYEESGHLCDAVLNSLDRFNPWAVFSRKLLLPDSLIDCQFQGLGFNFSKENKDYIHLIWHVRTRDCPEMMLVPARADEKFDAPIWISREKLCEYNFEKAGIDRAFVEWKLQKKLPPIEPKDPETGKAKDLPKPWLCGFVRFPGFDNTNANLGMPARWIRDTVPLDVVRAFRTQVHRYQFRLASNKPELLHLEFEYFIQVLNQKKRPFEIVRIPLPSSFADCNGFLLTLDDGEGRYIGDYLIIFIASQTGTITEDMAARLRRIAARGCGGHRSPLKALIAVLGIRSMVGQEIQDYARLHTEGQTPVYQLMIATEDFSRFATIDEEGNSIEKPFKRVAHAILPLGEAPGSIPDRLVITLNQGDTRWRLPGGRIEPIELQTTALIRELEEELLIQPDEILSMQPVIPVGHMSIEPSPTTSQLTHYQIFPFLVRLDQRGQSRVLQQLKQTQNANHFQVRSVTFREWRDTGLGFTTNYPTTVLDLLTPEALLNAAIVAPIGSATPGCP